MLIIILAIIVRLTALSFALHNVGSEGFISGDAIGYVALAQNIAAGNGFVTGPTELGEFKTEVFRTPGLPFVLSLFVYMTHGFAIYGVLLSIIAGIVLPLVTFAIARRLTETGPALVAAAMIAVEPHAVFYSFLLQTEIPAMLFAYTGLYALIRTYEENSYRWAIVAGALLASSIYIRPGNLVLFLAAILAVGIWSAVKGKLQYRQLIVCLVMMFAMLSPWYIRNHAVTGVYALSGAGWRNVYTDYLASVKSIENDTPFHIEKRKLREEAMNRFGMSADDVNSPAYSKTLRGAALAELWQHKITVIKLESVILLSFFTNDGYYYDFRNLGFVPENAVLNISPTHELLTKGVAAVPAVTAQLARQLFIPVWGRIVTLVVLILAMCGFILARHPLRFLFAGIIVFSALISSAIGFGVDARMRVPVEPLFFIFASVALVWLYDRIRLHYAR